MTRGREYYGCCEEVDENCEEEKLRFKIITDIILKEDAIKNKYVFMISKVNEV